LLRVSFALNVTLGEQEVGMASDWIQKRFQDHQKKTKALSQRRIWDQKAVDSVGAKFSELEDRIKLDVSDYNRLFGSLDAECKVQVGRSASSLTIERESTGQTVAVGKHESILKVLRYSGSITNHSPEETIEIIADDNGNILYRHKGKDHSDASTVSEIIIGPLLCG
jgi:hypothetical protein